MVVWALSDRLFPFDRARGHSVIDGDLVTPRRQLEGYTRP